MLAEKQISPTQLFRQACERIRSRLGEGFYNAQKEEQEKKIAKLVSRLENVHEFINLNGLEDIYVRFSETKESKQRRVRDSVKENDGDYKQV